MIYFINFLPKTRQNFTKKATVKATKKREKENMFLMNYISITYN